MTVNARVVGRGGLRETAEGYRQTEVWRVTEVGGNASRRFLDAAEASGVPRMGDPHPAVPGLRVIERDVSPASGGTAAFDVRIVYARPSADQSVDRTQPYGPASWRISARTTREETNRDARGELMRVYYQGYPILELLDLDNQTVDTSRSGVKYLAGRLHVESVDRPILFLEASRWERDNPEQRLRQHHGAINLEQWRGYAPGQVLLSDVGSDEDPSGGYRVTYGFAVNPDTWRVRTAIEIYQQVPQDATLGNGIFEFDVYRRVPFSTLALS